MLVVQVNRHRGDGGDRGLVLGDSMPTPKVGNAYLPC